MKCFSMIWDMMAFTKSLRDRGYYIIDGKEYELHYPLEITHMIGDIRLCCKILHQAIKDNGDKCKNMEVAIYTHQEWTKNVLMGKWRPKKKTPHSVEHVEAFKKLVPSFKSVKVDWMPYDILIQQFNERYDRLPRSTTIVVDAAGYAD